MKRIGLFWGSQTGNKELAATLIVEAIGSDIVQSYDIRGVDSGTFGSYDSLILGTSTWGAGELQDDWDSFFRNLTPLILSEKKWRFSDWVISSVMAIIFLTVWEFSMKT